MSLYTDLQNLTTLTEQQEIDRLTTYMSLAGFTDLENFLKSQALEGKFQALIHIEKSGNPQSRAAGFATLAGEIGILNAQASRGLIARNDIGWLYVNMPKSTIEQFQIEVTNIRCLLQNEGLTVTETIGSTMAELIVDWE